MTPWGISQVQVAWWTAGATTDVEAALKALGVEPSHFQRAQGVATAAGRSGEVSYQLQSAPGRIDLLVHPQDNNEGIPVLGDFDEGVKSVAAVVQKLVDRVGTAHRLAVVLTTLNQVASEPEAVALLLPQMDVKLSFGDATDLIFQINRRKTSDSGTEMNRLVKIESQSIQMLRMQTGISLPGRAEFAATFTADVNTVPKAGRKFEPVEQKCVFGELFAEAKRLCEVRSVKALA